MDAPTYTVFENFQRLVHTGTDLEQAIAAGREAAQRPGVQTVVLFDDTTGQRTEVDARGTADEVRARMEGMTPKAAGPGRPKLGVVSREVSLLPRHWDWLNEQPGGASAALRRLVDDARKQHPAVERARQAKDAAYKAMSVLAGDQPCFEAATRALYAGEFARAEQLVTEWPADLRDYAQRLLDAAHQAHQEAQPE